jgi:hypothetical protein
MEASVPSRQEIASFDRDESAALEAAESTPGAEKAEKPKTKSNSKATAKPVGEAGHKNGDVKLLVRLYFSAHEKLSEQRSVDRILADDLFKGASPKTVHESDKGFADLDKHFESLN